MKRKNFIALIGVWTCAIGLMLIAFPSHSVNAQPPSEGCVAVSSKSTPAPIDKNCCIPGLAHMRERAS